VREGRGEGREGRGREREGRGMEEGGEGRGGKGRAETPLIKKPGYGPGGNDSIRLIWPP